MFTPWNEVCAVKFPKWGKPFFLSEASIFQGYQAIPPGIYISSKGFIKSSIDSDRGWSFFAIKSRA